jgi:ADP-ribose pyrophosphatase
MKAKLLSSKVQHRNDVFTVTEERAIEPGGVEIRRAIIHHRGSAVMMPVDEHGRILLVRQFRLAAGASLWELPAGRVDEGETVLRAARRELLEETGLRARSWRKLIAFYASPGFLTEKMTIFLATDLMQGDAQPMEDERIECRWFKASEVDAAIRDGKIIDGKTQIGFLAWKRYAR